MLASIGGIIAIASFIFLLFFFRIMAHRRIMSARADLTLQSRSWMTFDLPATPKIWDVHVSQVEGIKGRTWADILPISAQYTTPKTDTLNLPTGRKSVQVNTLILMPSPHSLLPDGRLTDCVLGVSSVPYKPSSFMTRTAV